MYGYSLWIVPHNWKEIKDAYKMEHIPHVTVETNLTEPPRDVAPSRHEIRFEKPYALFPKMYENDPFTAYGFYCKVSGIKIKHYAHMSTHYNKFVTIFPEPPEDTWGTLVAADTRSEDCSKWVIFDK